MIYDTDISGNQNYREDHIANLVKESWRIINDAIEMYVGDREIVKKCALYSGGNDSTTMTHLFRNWVDCAVHVNTGIGIEQTRQFVRDTCASWNLPLIEEHPPPGSTYRELVLDQGFPGPAMHFKMYQRLKERGLMKVRRDYVKEPRKQRIIYLAGRRRDESSRRANVPEVNVTGSIVWISPMVHWTKNDLGWYRELNPDIPRNLASDTLHMSGECLCGAFAKPGELDEIAFWFPEVAAEIRELEKEVEAAGLERCRWGWGGNKQKPSKSGILCSGCDERFLAFEE